MFLEVYKLLQTSSPNKAPRVARINLMLPAEMLERVFLLLPARDRRVVVAVCRRWREVGETPSLWTWVTITIGAWNLDEGVTMLASRRLQGVSSLCLWAASPQVPVDMVLVKDLVGLVLEVVLVYL